MSLTAWPIDEYTSDAQVIRQQIGSLIGAAGGLVAAGGLEGTQKGTPSMAVLIKGGTPAEGGLWIPGYTTTTGPTYFQNTATYEQVIEAAGASNPRVDTIVARIYDTSLDSSGKHEPVFQALRGAEETGVTLANKKGAAAVPKNCVVLMYVLVPAKASSIVTADIENVATAFSAASNMLVPSAKSIIVTEQSRENSAYGTMPTPDEVTVVLPENGLIAVAYQATWKESVEGAGRAAIFLGPNQIVFSDGALLIQQQAFVETGTVNSFRSLSSHSMGLKGPRTGSGYPGDATTGQVVGAISSNVGGTAETQGYSGGGPCYIFAAAGTYKVSVQFNATSGKVTAKNRKLWVWVVA